MKRIGLIVMLLICAIAKGFAQEEAVYVGFGIPTQNTLMFNRFLLNPSFSAVGQENTALTLFHRNQSVSFDNNSQSYLMGYSGKTGNNTGAGISVFSQREGVVSNFGVLANYAYAVKLSENTNFTFGGNLAYYKSGYDQTRAVTGQFDPYLSGLQDGTFMRFQPGFNLQTGSFDFGVMAENLIDFDLKNGVSLSDYGSKTFVGHLQHTYLLEASEGITEGGRLRSLIRGRNTNVKGFELGASAVLDLPKLGWLQAGYDSYFGASTGVGFNLSPQLSMGYTMERGVGGNLGNLGMTHEITVAYSFRPKPSQDRIMLEADFKEDQEESREIDEPLNIESLEQENNLLELKEKLAQNDAILGQLTARPDSLEINRKNQLEKRFTEALETVRTKTGTDSFIRKNNLEVRENHKVPHENRDSLVEKFEKDSIDSGEVQIQFADLPEKATPSDSTHQPQVTFEQEITQKGKDTAIVLSDSPKPIKSKNLEKIKDAQDGYYLIANVYKGGVYLEKFIKQLNSKGFSPQYITNPETELKYVYLKRYETLSEAESAVKTKLEGKYSGSLWVLRVSSGNIMDKAASKSKTPKKTVINTNEDLLRKNVVVRDRIVSDTINKVEIKEHTEYYIIANVFASARNATRFIKYLNGRGLSASYFINPKNKYRYVYLKRHDSWNGALLSYYNQVTKIYEEKTWIMRVTPGLLS